MAKLEPIAGKILLHDEQQRQKKRGKIASYLLGLLSKGKKGKRISVKKC